MPGPSIHAWPRHWCADVQTSFDLKSTSLISSRGPLSAGAPDVYGPRAQIFLASITIPQKDRRTWQAISAFFSNVAGQAGFIRMFDPKRIRPGRDIATKPTTEAWADDTLFTDGTGWASGTIIPPFCTVYEAASAGANSVVLSGLPVSLAPALWAGDLMEFRPGGIPSAHGMLHEVAGDGPTDANGRTRVYFNPRLRKGVAAGDMVALAYSSSVFKATDDNQGLLTHFPGGKASTGFSLIEVLPT